MLWIFLNIHSNPTLHAIYGKNVTDENNFRKRQKERISSILENSNPVLRVNPVEIYSPSKLQLLCGLKIEFPEALLVRNNTWFLFP